MKKFFIGCGILIAIVVGLSLAAIIGLGYLIEAGKVPDSAALPKNKISSELVAKLRELKIVEADEEVQFYYSPALLSFEAEGYLFTDRRVISYENKDIYSATWDEIENIEFEDSDSFFEDAIITVTTTDDEIFILFVSAESNLDNAFYNQLEKLWQKGRSRDAAGPVEAEDTE